MSHEEIGGGMTAAQVQARVRARYVVPIDEGELAIRMAEAAIGIKRPPGKTTAEVLEAFPADWGEAFHRAARAALLYWKECIDKANETH